MDATRSPPFVSTMTYSTLCITTIAIILGVSITTMKLCWVRRGLRTTLISITTGHSRLITDKGACLSDTDCPISHFCNSCPYPYSCWGLPFSCMRRRMTGARCNFDSMCRSGNFCGPKHGVGDFFCQVQLPLDYSCGNWPSKNECLGENNRCDSQAGAPLSSKCTQFKTGFAGDRCEYIVDCQQKNGFFCNTSIQRCQRKKNAGEYCEYEAFDYACKDRCHRNICKPFLTIGDDCYEDEQCDLDPFISGDREERTCNFNEYETGKCVKKKDLLISLGAQCNPNNDICDRRRRLYCKLHVPSKTFACQHTGWAPYNSYYCAPNSSFSICKPNGSPQSCRLRNTLPDEKSYEDPTCIFNNCLPSLEYSRRGQLCGLEENSVCLRGLSCELIKGVPRNWDILTKYCVKIKTKVGDNCRNKFTSKCGIHLKCVKGKCETGEPTGTEIKTHLGSWEWCGSARGNDRLSCAPGLVCHKNKRRCVLPSKIMNEGEPCYYRTRLQPVSYN